MKYFIHSLLQLMAFSESDQWAGQVNCFVLLMVLQTEKRKQSWTFQLTEWEASALLWAALLTSSTTGILLSSLQVVGPGLERKVKPCSSRQIFNVIEAGWHRNRTETSRTKWKAPGPSVSSQMEQESKSQENYCLTKINLSVCSN